MDFHEKLSGLIACWPGSQNDHARSLGIDESHYSKLARGKSQPTRAQLVAIARFYGASLEWLADDALDDPPATVPPIDPAILTLIRLMSAEEALRRLSQIDDRAQPPDERLPSHILPPDRPSAPSRRGGE